MDTWIGGVSQASLTEALNYISAGACNVSGTWSEDQCIFPFWQIFEIYWIRNLIGWIFAEPPCSDFGTTTLRNRFKTVQKWPTMLSLALFCPEILELNRKVVQKCPKINQFTDSQQNNALVKNSSKLPIIKRNHKTQAVTHNLGWHITYNPGPLYVVVYDIHHIIR